MYLPDNADLEKLKAQIDKLEVINIGDVIALHLRSAV
jgi:hypothetical protein